MLKSPKALPLLLGLAPMALAGLMNVAQAPDPHQSVANDASPSPPLATNPDPVEPFGGTSALRRRPNSLSAPDSARAGGHGRSDGPPTVVIGDDDRLRIPSPNPYPYRAVVHVTSDIVGTCSGWLISRDTVITAGHCVYNFGKFTSLAGVVVASSIEGSNGPPAAYMTPFPLCGAKRVYSTKGWTSSMDEAFDYAAIKLDCQLGDLVGWFGAGGQPSPAGKPAKVVGYDPNTTASACDEAGTWHSLCTAAGGPITTTAQQLFYDTDVENGGSGGPVLLPTAPTIALGIHGWGRHSETSPHKELNHGVLITKRVFQNLAAWRKATVP
jgi:glutamyl endopeptidase